MISQIFSYLQCLGPKSIAFNIYNSAYIKMLQSYKKIKCYKVTLALHHVKECVYLHTLRRCKNGVCGCRKW